MTLDFFILNEDMQMQKCKIKKDLPQEKIDEIDRQLLESDILKQLRQITCMAGNLKMALKEGFIACQKGPTGSPIVTGLHGNQDIIEFWEEIASVNREAIHYFVGRENVFGFGEKKRRKKESTSSD